MMENEQQPIKKKKKRSFFLFFLLSGGILKEDFIVKHTRMIILIVVLLVFFIGNRYTCLLKLRQIDQLQKELQEIKYESIHVSGQLIESNRMSQIEQLVKSQGLKLESTKSPPYILYK